MVTVCLEFKTSKPFLTTMKIMVLKHLISHKLTFKKQNLYKKFEACLRIKKQKNKKPKKQGNAGEDRAYALLTLRFFFLRQNYKA